jgi:hypothetical protein
VKTFDTGVTQTAAGATYVTNGGVTTVKSTSDVPLEVSINGENKTLKGKIIKIDKDGIPYAEVEVEQVGIGGKKTKETQVVKVDPTTNASSLQLALGIPFEDVLKQRGETRKKGSSKAPKKVDYQGQGDKTLEEITNQ